MVANNEVTAVIIDDERNCIANLNHYLALDCPGIRIVGTASTKDDAAHLLQSGGFRLAFLDIGFGQETIFPLLERQPQNFGIVFVTAHEQYALKAFRVSALDYLLKPLCREDIRMCYQKISHAFAVVPDLAAAQVSVSPPRKVVLKEKDRIHILEQQDIHYLRAVGAYTEVVFGIRGGTGCVLLSRSLGALEEEYDQRYFFRVHKSYLVNLARITGIRKKEIPAIEIGKAMIPVAKRRLHELLLTLNTRKWACAAAF